AHGLARDTSLAITCVEFERERLAAARKQLDDAGLYGHRVTVELGTPEQLPYPDFAANLVIHLDTAAPSTELARELRRVLKPSGGVLWTRAADLPDVLKNTGALALVNVREQGLWSKLTRGHLKGAGWWTHQFADAGNSGSSHDQRVKWPLDVLWFG